MRFSIVIKRIIAVLCAGILAASLMWLLESRVSARNAARDNSSLREKYRGRESLLFPAALEESGESEVERPPVHADFADLYEINPHIVGWLAAGVDIDLPVVQYDNEFYLTHDFYGRSNSNGALFVNEANRLAPRDDVVLIHGHNMNSGAQFGRLRDFERYPYAALHPIVIFRTIREEEETAYVVAAAFNASMTEGNPEFFDIRTLRFGTDENGGRGEYAEYLAKLKNISLWDAPVDLQPTDELLMLVTCSYNQENGRFVLVCRRLRADETRETIISVFSAD